MFEPIIKKIPEIRLPKERLTFEQKIGLTIGVLALFFIFAQIPLYGIARPPVSTG